MRTFQIAAVALAVALGVGCGDNSTIYGDPTPLDHQSEAIEIIWSTFGAKIPMPTVFWVKGDALNCDNGTAFQTPIGCMAGLTDRNLPDFVQVALIEGDPIGAPPQTTPGMSPAPGSGLAHEMCHSLAARGGTTDGGGNVHGGECFRLGGLVDQANAALGAAGL